MAGGLNIASDAVATSPDSRIADYGIERLLSKAKDIDIYIAPVSYTHLDVYKRQIKGHECSTSHPENLHAGRWRPCSQ